MSVLYDAVCVCVVWCSDGCVHAAHVCKLCCSEWDIWCFSCCVDIVCCYLCVVCCCSGGVCCCVDCYCVRENTLPQHTPLPGIPCPFPALITPFYSTSCWTVTPKQRLLGKGNVLYQIIINVYISFNSENINNPFEFPFVDGVKYLIQLDPDRICKIHIGAPKYIRSTPILYTSTIQGIV